MRRLLVALLALGCTRAGESIVPVDVGVGAPLPGLTTVAITLVRGGASLSERKMDWARAQGGVLKVGLYLDPSVTGPVAVRASGLSASGTELATAPEQTTDVTPGKVARGVTLVLGRKDTATPAPDAGAPADAGAPPDAGADAGPSAPDAPPPATASAAWKPPENLQPNPLGDDADKPQVAVHPTRGDAVVIYLAGERIKTLRFDAASNSWGQPVTLDDRGGAYFPLLAMDGGSRVFAAWFVSSDDPALGGIWETRSDDGGRTWGTPARLHAGPRCRGLVLAGARSGKARLAWLQDFDVLPTITRVYTSYFDGRAWSPVLTVSEPPQTASPEPSLAMDDSGGGVLVWQVPDALGRTQLQGAHFTGAALDPGQDLFGPSYGSGSPLALASPDGNAVVLWALQSTQGGATNTVARWWRSGSWVAMPDRLPDVPVWIGKGVIDRTGAVTVAFDSYTGSAFNTGALRYEPGKGWGQPEALETDNRADEVGNPALREREYLYPLASADAAGNVQVIWRKKKSASNMVHSLVARRFEPGRGWLPEVTVAERPPAAVGYPTTMATSDDGRTLVSFVFVDYSLTLDQALNYRLHVAWFR